MAAISLDQGNQQPSDPLLSTNIEREGWTRPPLMYYQARALAVCRAHAYAHSPFYQRFHQGLMDRPLQELPVLTKAMMMEHFDELVTDRDVHLRDVKQYLAQADATKPFLDRYRAVTTSGTTGQPGIFINDRAEGAIMASAFARWQQWAGMTSESRVAVVASMDPTQTTSQFPIIINGQQVPRIQLSAHDPLDRLVQRLNEWQPDVLLPYTSLGLILANEQLQGRLRIAPRSVCCSAEAMTNDMRRRMEEAWQTRPFDIYGTTEGGPLAVECSLHQGLHIFEDFSIVEVVDKDNRPVPPGEEGEKVLLTVLFRRTQPLIRYELTDLVRTSTSEHCSCGRPFALLESIQGRLIEVLYLPSPTGDERGVHPFLFEVALDTVPANQWQVVQEHDGLHILLAGASEQLREEQLLDSLGRMLTEQGVIVPHIEIHRVTDIIKNPSGKTPLVLSHVPRRTS